MLMQVPKLSCMMRTAHNETSLFIIPPMDFATVRYQSLVATASCPEQPLLNSPTLLALEKPEHAEMITRATSWSRATTTATAMDGEIVTMFVSSLKHHTRSFLPFDTSRRAP